MKVDFGFNIQRREALRGMFINPAATVNQTLVMGGKKVRRDSVFLNASTQSSLIDHLREQREGIKARKNDLLATTLENGGSKNDIKALLDNYDAQMQELEEQITQLTTQQLQRQIKELALKYTGDEDEEEDDIAAVNRRMAKIEGIARQLAHAKTIDALKQQKEGEAAILKNELELDTALIERIEARAVAEPGLMSRLTVHSKEDTLAELEEGVLALTESLGHKLGEILEELQETGHSGYTNSPEAEKEETEETEATATEEV